LYESCEKRRIGRQRIMNRNDLMALTTGYWLLNDKNNIEKRGRKNNDGTQA
jgi:hypothetical protein